MVSQFPDWRPSRTNRQNLHPLLVLFGLWKVCRFRRVLTCMTRKAGLEKSVYKMCGRNIVGLGSTSFLDSWVSVLRLNILSPSIVRIPGLHHLAYSFSYTANSCSRSKQGHTAWPGQIPGMRHTYDANKPGIWQITYCRQLHARKVGHLPCYMLIAPHNALQVWWMAAKLADTSIFASYERMTPHLGRIQYRISTQALLRVAWKDAPQKLSHHDGASILSGRRDCRPRCRCDGALARAPRAEREGRRYECKG